MSLEDFTHIVVGAGSAGCLVAARIAENPAFRILLIEAGPDYASLDAAIPYGIQNARKIPMKGQSELYDSAIDWNLVVDLPGAQPMVVPQAKIVGGGSSINGGTALRNTEADCEEWVKLGNHAWDYRTVCKIYDSLEDDEVRGTRGPHPITRITRDEAGQIQNAFVEGALSSGFEWNHDLNAAGANGVGSSPVCRRGDQRISAANTFIDPIRQQKNFRILPKTTVHSILFDGSAAVGALLEDGTAVSASHEVILCAGAIHSPAILQRSGIGPSDVLKSFNLPVISDLPVGRNLFDHVCIPLVARPKHGAYVESDYSLQMQARWSSSLHPHSADYQIVCFSFLYAAPSDPQLDQRTLAGTVTGHVAGIGCNLNKPTSLGTVTILSHNADELPNVRPNYLATSHDRRAAREIVRKAYEVLTSPSMQRVLHEPFGLDRTILGSNDLLDRWISEQYSTTYHFCGTCKMADCSHGGVVDQSGRVYGVQRLRVCDASIIPTVPAANTMWPTMMFAERIGCSIRDDKAIYSEIGTLEAKL
ncbi:GMC oxidoreductase-like protein 6 [Elsinoe fawcettii]|nr:GMC oxidoreductase-like protein 6 [Elsinoe fawcettii]